MTLPYDSRFRKVQEMQVQHKNSLFEVTFWLIAEILLNLVGLDTIADYNEFISNQKDISIVSCPLTASITVSQLSH
jgi:hypothetical protein